MYITVYLRTHAHAGEAYSSWLEKAAHAYPARDDLLLAFLDRATTMDGTIVRVHARKKVVKEQAVSSPWRDLEDCVRSTEATIGVRRQVCVVVVERQRPKVRGDGGWGWEEVRECDAQPAPLLFTQLRRRGA